MSRLRIHVLGSLNVSGTDLDQPRLPKSVWRFVALIAAAGPEGIGRDQMADELWGEPLPESWKSAIRNRVAAARKLLGAETILNESGRFRFHPSVTIDSWDLLAHRTSQFSHPGNELNFLDGEPLIGIEPSPLLVSHIQQVADARCSLLTEMATTVVSPFSALALQKLRDYQRRHPLEPALTTEAIRAHVVAGETGHAATIVAEVRSLTKGPKRKAHRWVEHLDQLFDTNAPRRRHDDNKPTPGQVDDVAEIGARAELFASAVDNGEWNVALEIALSGLPEAERIDGDPERLKLLEAISLDKLDPARRFTFCLAMARHLMYARREAEACEWSATTRGLATSPEEELLSYITAAIVGDSPDERTSIPLPASFESAADDTINMQSLQVAVMSHLERAPFAEASPLRDRFNGLVESSADPYRRWHKLLLESMTRFVEGEIEAAADVSRRAFKYAELFGIVDAEIALIAHQSNAHWVHRGFPVEDFTVEYPASTSSRVGRALRAAELAPIDEGKAVHEFMRTFDWRSRSFFSFPVLMVVAGHIRDATLRAQVAERFKKRAGTSAIWGTGVLHLGPVDRVLAQLVDSPADRDLHLAAAVHVADRQATRLWQVVCRLDLATATNNQHHRDQAESLATTPALQQIVRDYSDNVEPTV